MTLPSTSIRPPRLHRRTQSSSASLETHQSVMHSPSRRQVKGHHWARPAGRVSTHEHTAHEGRRSPDPQATHGGRLKRRQRRDPVRRHMVAAGSGGPKIAPHPCGSRGKRRRDVGNDGASRRDAGHITSDDTSSLVTAGGLFRRVPALHVAAGQRQRWRRGSADLRLTRAPLKRATFATPGGRSARRRAVGDNLRQHSPIAFSEALLLTESHVCTTVRYTSISSE